MQTQSQVLLSGIGAEEYTEEQIRKFQQAKEGCLGHNLIFQRQDFEDTKKKVSMITLRCPQWTSNGCHFLYLFRERCGSGNGLCYLLEKRQEDHVYGCRKIQHLSSPQRRELQKSSFVLYKPESLPCDSDALNSRLHLQKEKAHWNCGHLNPQGFCFFQEMATQGFQAEREQLTFNFLGTQDIKWNSTKTIPQNKPKEAIGLLKARYSQDELQQLKKQLEFTSKGMISKSKQTNPLNDYVCKITYKCKTYNDCPFFCELNYTNESNSQNHKIYKLQNLKAQHWEQCTMSNQQLRFNRVTALIDQQWQLLREIDDQHREWKPKQILGQFVSRFGKEIDNFLYKGIQDRGIKRKIKKYFDNALNKVRNMRR